MVDVSHNQRKFLKGPNCSVGSKTSCSSMEPQVPSAFFSVIFSSSAAEAVFCMVFCLIFELAPMLLPSGPEFVSLLPEFASSEALSSVDPSLVEAVLFRSSFVFPFFSPNYKVRDT